MCDDPLVPTETGEYIFPSFPLFRSIFNNNKIIPSPVVICVQQGVREREKNSSKFKLTIYVGWRFIKSEISKASYINMDSFLCEFWFSQQHQIYISFTYRYNIITESTGSNLLEKKRKEDPCDEYCATYSLSSIDSIHLKTTLEHYIFKSSHI